LSDGVTSKRTTRLCAVYVVVDMVGIDECIITERTCVRYCFWHVLRGQHSVSPVYIMSERKSERRQWLIKLSTGGDRVPSTCNLSPRLFYYGTVWRRYSSANGWRRGVVEAAIGKQKNRTETGEGRKGRNVRDIWTVANANQPGYYL